VLRLGAGLADVNEGAVGLLRIWPGMVSIGLQQLQPKVGQACGEVPVSAPVRQALLQGLIKCGCSYEAMSSLVLWMDCCEGLQIGSCKVANASI
jgi:hypothetical protein